MPNNNIFGFESESEGRVFCACDDMRGWELDRAREVSGDGRDGLGLAGMTSGFGLCACTSVNNRAWEQ